MFRVFNSASPVVRCSVELPQTHAPISLGERQAGPDITLEALRRIVAKPPAIHAFLLGLLRMSDNFIVCSGE